MPQFVKICPKSGRTNPEYENLCAGCQQFIGMEPAVPKPAETGQAKTEPDPVESAAAEPQSDALQQTAPASAPDEHPASPKAPPTCYISVHGTGQVFTLHDGTVLGQAHATSQATVQIPAGIDGVECVHRQHCRFEYRDSRWHVQALDQTGFNQDFTNPTRVNQHLIRPGTWHPLDDGDELRLSGVGFQVKII